MYYGMSAESLQKLYLKGSLKNQDDGFEFQLKNLIDSGSISGITKLTVDGEDKLLDGVILTIGEKTLAASEISWSASLYIYYGATLTIFIPGALQPGEHTVLLQVNAPELGQITLPVTDTIEA
ncbi:MAG: hypothetical protein P1S60_01205 [Anaerolineae bacterium]|nr:hypothetical protein [Anaerolineae bacterium]